MLFRSFRHALLHEAACEAMPHAQRLQAHRRLAELMRIHLPERVRRHPEQLAQHLDQGHSPDAAAAWLAAVLIGVKAYYLGVPGVLARGDGEHYLRSLAAISHGDVLFAAAVWCVTTPRRMPT